MYYLIERVLELAEFLFAGVLRFIRSSVLTEELIGDERLDPIQLMRLVRLHRTNET